MQTRPAPLLDRLAEHQTLRAAPREELDWLVAHGSLRRLAVGEVLTAQGTNVPNLTVVLSGCLAIWVDRGAGRHKVTEWRGGDVLGLLPYSRLTKSPGDVMAQEPSDLLEVPGDCLRMLTRDCHAVTTILVHSMLDRARLFNASDLQDEKMLSLGRLSAGLAHELNNPASAIARSAALLGQRLGESERAERALGSAGLDDSELAKLEGLRASCSLTSVPSVRSPIEQADREEAIAQWLERRGLDTSLAEGLADSNVTFAGGIDQLVGLVEPQALDTVLHWLASGCAVRSLAAEIQDAAHRVSGLVKAIKGFTHMDQATVAEPFDLIEGLNNTITVLKAKARAKSVAVILSAPHDLPQVRGFSGELNQVWANLIDNALDAVADSGRVEVEAHREARRVVVQVVDNGAGIPEEIRNKIFEPFFTTKPMGQGTGLGLDIAARLVRHSDGDLAVESAPGRTVFRVSLPVAETDRLTTP
jgi:signal transduction histidine kinase